MSTKVAIGCDHAGYELKEVVKEYLARGGNQVADYGTDSTDSVDYPDFVHPVAGAVERGDSKLGVLICGSGNGVAMTANKHAGIRAAVAWNKEISALARQHNDANIICLPARFISEDDAIHFISIFLNTAFEGGRHQRRVEKIPC